MSTKQLLIGTVFLALSSGISAQQGPTVGYSVEVPVGLSEAWRLWTEPAALREWFSPNFAVDVRPGGPFEIYFDPSGAPGMKGCEGCTVMAVDPESMLTFSWNLPPDPATIELRQADHMTFVQVRFHALDEDRTRVTLVNSGYGSGPEWNAGVGYFRQAWRFVMSWYRYRAESGPIDWSAPPMEFPEGWVSSLN